MAIALGGYALLDKGFAYIGYPPFFVGEALLGFMILSAMAGAFSYRVFNSPIIWVLFVFVLWQVIRTLPYLQSAGLNAIRDAAAYYYALFAILFGAMILRGRSLLWLINVYGKWIPWFLLFSLPIFFITQKFRDIIPRYPGSDAMVIWLKPGDMAVHLAGIAAFMALGFHRYFPTRDTWRLAVMEFCMWAMLTIDVVAAGSRNRGGFVSVVIACLAVTVLKPMNRMTRLVIPLLFVVVVAAVVDVDIPVGGGRSVSIQQMGDNIQSIFFKSNRKELATTSEWRKEWWEVIIKETIHGKYFWLGRGYGANLAEVHGFADWTANRSPHNAHLMFLSRGGVPSLVLWIVLQGVIVWWLLLWYFRSRRAGVDMLANLNLWVMAYMFAFLVNSSFDVYLEGPQGGIWYWCVVGLAIALTEEERVLVAYRRPRYVTTDHAYAQGSV